MSPQETEEEPSVHAMTVRLPEDVYEDLRRQAYEKHMSINALIIAAVRAQRS